MPDLSASSPAPSLRYRGRFAPSPTGPLHLGSLAAALASWLFARRAGGAWLLRIEDIDPPREQPGAAELQIRTLAAFGMSADEPVLRQSRRIDAYRAALDRLVEQGQAFECHCSRRMLAARPGVHRACLPGAQRANPAIRFRVPDKTASTVIDVVRGRFEQRVDQEVGDFVIRRADGLISYQLAVVVDDQYQGITEVIRGADLLDSTPRQILLQRALGYRTPSYGHIPLVVDASGRKLSKSLAAVPIDPDDPVPALSAAWAALGQDIGKLPRSGPAERVLQHALAAFEPTDIGKQAFGVLSLASGDDLQEKVDETADR
ncbi:MAG: tRNA glutamyl-Q(34) synthetase GluQRS [Xanthomonadaceae bacterium]|nr:tRNA glutamyl-Q(34) synthetase GluQRS [Xanthomonadaceae bacterium]